MDITQPLALLGGQSPQAFMKRHWQKKPLLIRNAVPAFSSAVAASGAGGGALLARAALFNLAADDSVESRLVAQETVKGTGKSKGQPKWQLKTGPFQRRSLPALKQPNWTLLVQGLDLHHDGIRALLDQFRFVPDGRLDDVMASYATPGGGVGPHFDSYDVFLLQVQGRRRWQISQQKDLSLVDGAPLKILAHFVPEETFVLEPGDMLYLPPRCAHDGVALDDCITYSIGFQAPQRGELARELLLRLADDAPDELGPALYADPKQAAVSSPGEIPLRLFEFAQAALARAVRDPAVLARALGELLTEPKSNVWFAAGGAGGAGRAADVFSDRIELDRRTKMMFDAQHIFINGESFSASGRDATLMKRLADDRLLIARDLARCSPDARGLIRTWIEAGWMHER